MTAMDVENNSY